ncbi:Putrescine importer PuuP [Paraburkholderia sediminicola]|uniref:Putrescine importer PuuP n=1 Tax=Paraburkholderia sediminicola TaxID=458836 RepID=A0A6J5CRY2_9BURK|nr:Putrescine importer PuuP [Paraburkholderia sediminicola]
MEQLQAVVQKETPNMDTECATLTGRLGTLDIVFTVLAYNAPLAVVVGLIPIIIAYGNGLGAPVTFVAVAILMLLFSVGFTTMSRHVPNAGAYYAYITVGLGPCTGLGSAFMAMLAYAFFIMGGYPYAGVIIGSFATHLTGKSEETWWLWAIILWAVVSVLGYFRITLSARVLTLALVCEILLVAVWEGAIALTKGYSFLSPVWLSPTAVMSGSVGLAILFGVTCFAGFEATAVFREEARDPEVTVPRATYLSIIIMACVFVSATYFFIVAYGPAGALAKAGSEPATAALDSIAGYLGHVGQAAVSVLMCTSMFACQLALHNILARYIYSLSIDGVLPPGLGAIHSRHGSPYRASLLVSVLGVVSVTVLTVTGADPFTAYAALVGITGFTLILLQILTSLSVILFFRRSRVHPGRWKTMYAPAASLVGLVMTGWLAISNIEMLTGNLRVAQCLLAIIFASLIGGIAYANRLRSRRPTVFAAIGRKMR